MSKIKVAGYVKLAKLWERSREQAIVYHHNYYEEKYKDNPDMELVDVYIDITGQKQIYKRPEMLRLLRDCVAGKINIIAAQTKGYFAANSQELCYLIKFLFDLSHRVDLITEDNDYRVDTVKDIDNQRKALQNMAENYIILDIESFEVWKEKITEGIKSLSGKEDIADNE